MRVVRVKVTVEKRPQSSVLLDIAADPEEFGKAMDRAFRKINQQVRIPGFRPGKAPRGLLEQRVGREVLVEEAQREIMDRLYQEALEQEKLSPVSEPEVDVYQDEPLAFRVEVQVYPEVDLDDYQSIRVEPREVTVSDEDVEAVLKDLQQQHGVWIEPQEPRRPQDGDQATIDLRALLDGEPFQEPVEDMPFEVGAGVLLPQIEEQVRSLLPGESTEFDVTFAEDDERANPDLRGKTLHYQLTLKELKERELPEIDDEFATTVGDYGSLDELRAAIRQDLLRQRATDAQNAVVNEAIDQLAERASIEVPPAMVDHELEHEIDDLRQELSREGSSLEEFLRFGNRTLEDYKEEIRPEVERRVRRSLALEAFAKAEGVEVTEEDLDAEIERLTAGSADAEQMREIYHTPYIQQMLAGELGNRKLTDRLIEIVTDGKGAVTGEGADVLRAAREAPAVERTSESAAPAGAAGDNEAESEAAEATVEPSEPAGVGAGEQVDTASRTDDADQ